MVPANARRLWPPYGLVDRVDPGLERLFDGLVDHQAPGTVCQRRDRRSAYRLTIGLVTVIKVDAVEAPVVPQLPDLHPVEDHDVVEACDQQGEGDDLVVNPHALTHAQELAADVAASAVRVHHHVVDHLQARASIAHARVLGHLLQEQGAKCVQVVGRPSARLAAAFGRGGLGPLGVLFLVQRAVSCRLDELVDALEGVDEQALLRVR